jgi:hypothetical protein
VSLESGRDHYTRRILTEVEAGNGVSQRSLARSVGIALGLTNLLLKRSIRAGWIRIIHVKPNRVKYLITPAGVAEKARMSSAYFAYATRFYGEARDRVRERFSLLSATWPDDLRAPDDAKRVLFYGRGEVAEIACVCLQETDLTLAGAVDPESRRHLFGAPVHAIDWLDDQRRWTEFGVVALMSFRETDLADARAHLTALQFPPNRIFSI